MLNIELLIPNKYQPRKIFDDIDSLAKSIKTYGIINPILVRKKDNLYEIIAGERRYRAAKKIGLTEVPAIIKDANEQQMAELALIENIQRQELSAIEEAKSYEEILRIGNQTQSSLAEKLGKSQASIANKIRLLSLPEEIQEALSNKKISERHARSLIAVTDKEKQIELLNRIIKEKLTVKETEQIINESEINEQEINKAISEIMKSLKNKEDKKEDDNMNNGNFFPNFDNNNNTNNNNTSLNMMNMQSMNQPQMNQTPDTISPAIPTPEPVPTTNPYVGAPQTIVPTPDVAPAMNQFTTIQNPTQPPLVGNTNNNIIPDSPTLQNNFINPQGNNFNDPIINDAPLFGVEPQPIQPNADTPQVSIPIVDEPLFNPNVTMPGPLATPEPAQTTNEQPTPAVATPQIQEPMMETPVTNNSSPAPEPSTFEIPVMNQQDLNSNAISNQEPSVINTTDRLTELQNILTTNGYTYKTYSNETTSCLIIELPKN